MKKAPHNEMPFPPTLAGWSFNTHFRAVGTLWSLGTRWSRRPLESERYERRQDRQHPYDCNCFTHSCMSEAANAPILT